MFLFLLLLFAVTAAAVLVPLLLINPPVDVSVAGTAAAADSFAQSQ